ncbi:hypothetical protein [Serratia fonticola]|uniref:hypothetical protein n=1 Tax=Serratia fonticola TaxID=47917 RepID=UPI0027EFE30F|nr:hypothetical protein [Serratia fonticola]MDQ7210272.1 hypothetical protein [Serratia fonticola]HBE9079628.1 hypothetical protein [Serratia fonticola]HBE9089900.1 hypothetical protein [Serratia fonticola]HBE9152666.1 hypothetical protein [Serratia fonticola]
MKMYHKLLKTAVGGLIGLASCQVLSAPADLSVKSISVPAYNLISDTLIEITPQVKGKRNEFMMQLVCDLARGGRNQQEVNQILKQNNIDAKAIPLQGNALSLLVNNDKEQQQTACASFVATSIFFPANNSVFFDKKNDEKNSEPARLNQEAFAREMKVRMSIAQATAQFYAVIANNLKKDKNMSWADYQQDVASITESYAAEYLNSIKKIYNANQATYTPVAITIDGLDVIDSRGLELVQTPNISVLKSRGVDWLGNGKILGKEYFVEIRVIDSKSPVRATEEKAAGKIKRKSNY